MTRKDFDRLQLYGSRSKSVRSAGINLLSQHLSPKLNYKLHACRCYFFQIRVLGSKVIDVMDVPAVLDTLRSRRVEVSALLAVDLILDLITLPTSWRYSVSWVARQATDEELAAWIDMLLLQHVLVFFVALVFLAESSEAIQLHRRGVTATEMPEAGSQDGCSPCSQAAGNPSTAERAAGWDSLPYDLRANILRRADFRDLFRFRAVSKDWLEVVETDVLKQLCDGLSDGTFTAINYYIKNGTWRFSGYNLRSKSWKAFPPLSYLPLPDADLFKEYSLCGHGGLMCAEVSKLPNKGELVVFNPLTRESQALPPLLYPRIPVLVHLSVDSANESYKVIVAGSSSASDEHLSKKVEVFDSSTSKWKEINDLPGPSFGLNEHQAGVRLNGILFFISFLESGDRGVVAFDLKEESWLEDLTARIPWSASSNLLQLVESEEKLFVFSEHEQGLSVDHRIDELEFPNPEAGVLSFQWRSVLQVPKVGGRGLQVYPEYTCVPFGAEKLCIFNTLNCDGTVYDMRDGQVCEALNPPGKSKGDSFFSLNPASFVIDPNFDIETSFTKSLDSDRSIPISPDPDPRVPNSVGSPAPSRVSCGSSAHRIANMDTALASSNQFLTAMV